MLNEIFEGLSKGAQKVAESLKSVTVPEKIKEEDTPYILLTAEKLKHLQWMSTDKLEVIFHHGKANVRLDDNPEVFSILQWMGTDKLKAIFGEEVPMFHE